MNLGRWDSAVLKSVFFPALLVLIYTLYEIGLPQDLYSWAGFGLFSLIFLGVYLLFSIVGWLLFGFPVHWLICRYGNGSYFLYFGAAVVFTVVIYIFSGVVETAIIYGSFALIQAMLFKYYAYKQVQT
ncbi:hypothetical protein [Microbulbifer sp. JMSA003]|uniref:hypothetical protein n=1 Tax=Microbulbifer sp. JMSA003 TaxID=3243369 RepID=UPI004039E7C4